MLFRSVAAAGVAVNGISALMFRSGSKGDVNVRGAFLHLVADAAVSAGVVIAGAVLWRTGWVWKRVRARTGGRGVTGHPIAAFAGKRLFAPGSLPHQLLEHGHPPLGLGGRRVGQLEVHAAAGVVEALDLDAPALALGRG